MLQIAVNGFRHTDYLHAAAVFFYPGEEFFGQQGCVGVGIVSPDDNNGINILFPANGFNFVNVFGLFDLCPITAHEVKPAGINDLCYMRSGYFKQIPLQQTLWPGLDSHQGIFRP